MELLTVISSFFGNYGKSLTERLTTNSGSKSPIRAPGYGGPYLSRLTSGIFFIHAIANPVSSLLINLDLCLEALADSPDQAELFLVQAVQDVKHIQRLIHTVHQPANHVRMSFTVRSAIQEVVTRWHQPWRQQFVLANLHVSATSRLPGSAFYFQEAMSCLIRNGFEAYGLSRPKIVTLSCFKRRQQLIFHVMDNGSGMGWTTRQLINVERFSLKRQHTGLGLRFVSQVVRQYYVGKLYIHSTPGSGTTVTGIIPLKN